MGRLDERATVPAAPVFGGDDEFRQRRRPAGEDDREPEDGDGDGDGDDEDDGASDTPGTLRGHTREVIGESSGRVRLLDATFGTLAEGDAGEAFELVADAETVPRAVVVDAELDQRLLDVAAQRGIDHVVAGSTGEFVKRPTSVRIRTAEQLLAPNEA
jgi:hypothetical protein